MLKPCALICPYVFALRVLLSIGFCDAFSRELDSLAGYLKAPCTCGTLIYPSSLPGYLKPTGCDLPTDKASAPVVVLTDPEITNGPFYSANLISFVYKVVLLIDYGNLSPFGLGRFSVWMLFML